MSTVDLGPPREEELAEAIGRDDGDGCTAWLRASASLDTAHALGQLTGDQREQLLSLLAPEVAAEVVEQLPEAQAVDAMEGLEPSAAARILEELPSDERADLIGELDTEDAAAILGELAPEDAAVVRRLAAYDDDVAGGLMMTEFLSFPTGYTVRDVMQDLEANAEQYATYNIQYTYVVDDSGALAGVLPVRRLLLAPRREALGALMIPDPVTVSDTMPLEELAAVFRDEPYIGLPVVDASRRLLGVVERSDVEHALVEDADETYRQSQGIVGGEELRSMPLVTRSRRRLAWLSINIVLNILAASIIALHQDTLEAVIALAVFLPIISDMSGCSGNQAVAVSMRELTLGVARPRDILAVLRKELAVGLCNGIALGLLIGLVALAWKGNVALGVVVGAALMLNTMVAVAIGGAVPLLLKGLSLDPALASGPILTTVTDMCGFLLVLSFAAAAMSHLSGL